MREGAALLANMAVIAIPPLSEALPEERDGLNLLVIGTTFASFLIPIAILLFFLTPIKIWRSPLFVLNVCAIILGLTQQIIYNYVIVSSRTVFLEPNLVIIDHVPIR